MIKNWVKLLLFGFTFSAFLCGIVLGGSKDLATFFAAVSMTFVPLIFGIHAGVSFMREDKPFNSPA